MPAEHHPSRRTVLKGAAGAAALVVAGAAAGTGVAQARPVCDRPTVVPFSAGNTLPAFRAPLGATDCHIHVFDPDRFPYPNPTSTPPPKATIGDYLQLRSKLGTARTVIVTPSNYATDNRCTLDGIAQLGKVARGIGVIDDTFTDAQLADLDAGGIRGIRFNLTRPGGAGAELIRPLAAKVAKFGWHVQIHMTADGILENIANGNITDLPTDLVIDHMGRIPGATGTAHPAYAAICRLIDAKHTWVKLSGVYHESVSGPPTYADRSAVGKAFASYAPERMVWGSDWPHPTASRGEVPMPDDAAMLDIFARWVPKARDRHRIMVENPTQLYGFRGW